MNGKGMAITIGLSMMAGIDALRVIDGEVDSIFGSHWFLPLAVALLVFLSTRVMQADWAQKLGE